ncbi:hypothetical protein FQN54_007593 [Arachnomyces sp. PD_36]|nr:hypothetical protein FQN54_007593 [Arachnomyces sp. PD_36]
MASDTTSTEVTSQQPFDPSTKYKTRTPGVANANDGREIQLLHFIHSLPNLDSEIRGSPTKVLAAIDLYCQTQAYLMNVGPSKGKIVTDLIAELKPHTMIELGGYAGYSAVLFGDAVRRAGGKRYLSLELNPEFAAVSRALVDLAGLGDVVKVHVGRSDLSIRRLFESGELVEGGRIELMFMDHYKPAYVDDLKLCEELGIVVPGTVITADNVVYPGAPEYLDYVRSSVGRKREGVKARAGRRNGEEAELRTRGGYATQIGSDKPAEDSPGNPNLIYENTLVKSFEPTGEPDGVEVTKCVGIASDA